MPGRLKLAGLFVAFLFGGTGFAAMSVAIVPPVIEEVTRPGRDVSGTISYRNNGAHPMDVAVSIVDFQVGEQNEVVEAPPGTTPASLARYLRIVPTTARIEPGQEAYFRYSAAAPEELVHLRAMIYFLSTPDRGEASGPQVLLAARLGVPLYLESSTAALPDLVVDERRWRRRGDGELVLDMQVTNHGERIFRPSGEVEIRSPEGSFERTFTFNDGREPVLPGQRRRWQVSFGPVPGGELSARLLMQTSPKDRLRVADLVPASAP